MSLLKLSELHWPSLFSISNWAYTESWDIGSMGIHGRECFSKSQIDYNEIARYFGTPSTVIIKCHTS